MNKKLIYIFIIIFILSFNSAFSLITPKTSIKRKIKLIDIECKKIDKLKNTLDSKIYYRKQGCEEFTSTPPEGYSISDFGYEFIKTYSLNNKIIYMFYFFESYDCNYSYKLYYNNESLIFVFFDQMCVDDLKQENHKDKLYYWDNNLIHFVSNKNKNKELIKSEKLGWLNIKELILYDIHIEQEKINEINNFYIKLLFD